VGVGERERERGGGGWEGGREGESESMRVFARTLASCVRMAHGHMPKWAHAQVQNNWRSNEEGDGRKRRRRRRRGRRGETVSPLPEMRVAIMGWSEGSFLR